MLTWSSATQEQSEDNPQPLTYTQVRWAFLFNLSALFVSSTGVIVVDQQSPSPLTRSWIWLGRPRCGPVHGPERDFWPLSQKPNVLPVNRVLFVIWSTCRQLEPWLHGDLWWHRTRATAGPSVAPDVKAAKNQHQVCSIEPCAGAEGDLLISAARICCTNSNTGRAKQAAQMQQQGWRRCTSKDSANQISSELNRDILFLICL